MRENILNCNKTFDKSEIKKLVSWFLGSFGSVRTGRFLDDLKFFGFKYSTLAGVSINLDDLQIPDTKEAMMQGIEKDLLDSRKRVMMGKLTEDQQQKKTMHIWNNINELLKNEVVRNFRETDLLNSVYMMTFSGARGNIVQVKQLVGMRGLMTDSSGEVLNLPIKSNLKEGLEVNEHFISCYGARKGIVDTSLKTANAGYLTRRLIYVCQDMIVKQPDCRTKEGILIVSHKRTKEQYQSTKNNLLGRVLLNNLYDVNNNELIASNGQDICNYLARKIIINKKRIFVRSSLQCKLNNGVCQLCYGWSLTDCKLVEVGETVGIIAAQSIGEPGTQLTMRTFHTGGVFSSKAEEVITSDSGGVILYDHKKDMKKIITRYGDEAFINLLEKKIIVRESDKNFYEAIIPRYSIILPMSGQSIFPSQIIAESANVKKTRAAKPKDSSKFNTIRCGTFGKVISCDNKAVNNGIKVSVLHNTIKFYKSFHRLSSKNSIKNENILNVVNSRLSTPSTFKQLDKNNDFYPTNFNCCSTFRAKKVASRKIYRKKKNILTILHNVSDSKQLIGYEKWNIRIVKLDFFNLKDFVLGKLLKKKDYVLNKYYGRIVEKTKTKLVIRKGSLFSIPTFSKLKVSIGDRIDKNTELFISSYEIRKNEDIVQGLPKIENLFEARQNSISQKKLYTFLERYAKKYSYELACKKSVHKIQKFIIKKVQAIYKKQGVNILDKHLELIVRKMTSKVIITYSGGSNVLFGEIIDLIKIEKINRTLKQKAVYEPILLGITRTSLLSESFVSAACFQETIRVLTKAAIEGKVDWLRGLKENVIVGNLIPAGTGFQATIM